MGRSVVLVRTGSPIYFENNGSAKGDTDTVPLIRELASMLHGDLWVYGALRGDIAECDPGLAATGLNTMCSPRDLKARISDAPFNLGNDALAESLEDDARRIAESDPLCFIDAWGATPTWSTPFNPHEANVYDYAIHYSLAMLYVMMRVQRMLGRHIPRIGFVTDPKCYKRDGEMSNIWPELIPRAVLSQENDVFVKTAQGVKYGVRAVDAGCAYWNTRDMRPRRSTREIGCVVAGHTHSTASVLPTRRRDLWRELAATLFDGTVICGNGWGCLGSQLDRFKYLGVLPEFQDVYDLMARGRQGPMVTMKPGFATSKIRLYALNGCCPCPVGSGYEDELYTYDPHGLVLPLDHYSRWPSIKSYRQGRLPLVLSDQQADETVQLVLDRTRPDFSRLWSLIDCLDAHRITGREPEYQSEYWLNTYGGYVRL